MGITHTHNSTYRSELPGEGNVQWRASFEFLPKGRGNDHLVFNGRMFRPGQDFYLTRQHAAVKVSRLKAMSADDWDFYLNCSEEGKKYNKAFRDIIKLHKLKIQISFLRPCVAPVDTVSKVTRKVIAKKYKRKFKSGEYVIIERFLKGKFQDFISVIGEVLDKKIGILEAFSHFTYWQSSGELLICGLKGVRSTVDRGENGGEWKRLELSSPCIHSMDGDFGPDDLGEEGIKMFFQHHKCNQICNSWADFKTLNRQRVLNSSFVPVDADVSEQTVVKAVEETEFTEASPTKENELLSHLEPPAYKEKDDLVISPEISYIPPKPYPTNLLMSFTDEDDSGIDSSPSASTPDGSIDSLASFSEIINPETDQKIYFKTQVERPMVYTTEVTIPKSLSLDCEKAMADGHTIVFQHDGERTMKPIIKNGCVPLDGIEIQIEPILEDPKKSKRVSWNPNVGSH